MLNKMLLFLCLCAISGAATLNVTPSVPLQGNSIRVELWSDNVVQNGRVIFNKTTAPLYLSAPGKYTTMLGTAYDWPTGNYPLQVVYQRNGQTVTQSARITLRAGKFDISTLTISAQKQQEGATDFAALAEENKTLGEALRAQKKGAYLDGPLVYPLGETSAPISSPYGVQRYYRDAQGRLLSSWAHRGIDYAVPSRTPVYAAQHGVIAVASKMKVHGNTIVIDHGQGILSIYNHLDELLVQKNQYVTKNALIAYSGNTGLSTGPHLHYGLSVHNVRVNPQEWLDKKWR